MTHRRILMAIDAATVCKTANIQHRVEAIAKHTGAQINTLQIKSNSLAHGMRGAFASLANIEHAIHFEPEKVASHVCERGDPVVLTNHFAQNVAADLVVTAEHISEKFLLNRDDDKALLRNAHHDMLFVNSNVQEYKTALCLVNIEHKNADQLILKAKRFADEMNADLHLAYVIGTYPYAGLEHLGQDEARREEEDFLRTCSDKLQLLAEVCDIPSNNQHIRVGKMTPIIKQTIYTSQADLLIMANQQQHGLRRFSPSLPAKMIHQIECDVLAIYCEEPSQEVLKRFYYH